MSQAIGATKGAQKLRFFLFNNVSKNFFEIWDGFSCGRLEGDLKFPADDVVSRKHCRFSVEGSTVYIEDLHSRNHTKLNTVPIRPGYRRKLHLNDVIEFGVQRFILTNQQIMTPGPIQDVFNATPFYKALPQADGSLTSRVPEGVTKRTLVLLDRYKYRALQIKEALFRRPPPFKRAHSGTREIQRSRFSSVKFALGLTLAFSLALIGVWAAQRWGIMPSNWNRWF